MLLVPARFAHARYSSRMIDRFLNWGDRGKPKSGKIKGRCQPPLLVYIRWCPPWRHIVVWRHGAFFVSRKHSTCLFIVCETMFTVGESHAISHVNGTEQQTQELRIQQPAVNPRRGRFDTKTESSGARTPTWNSTRATKKETAATNSGSERTSLTEFRMLKYF